MKQLIIYGNERFAGLHRYLEKYRQDAKPEHLHMVRVELKKIKTFFELIAFCSNQFNATKSYKPLKLIFKKAGHIRESEILHKLFKQYKIKVLKKTLVRQNKAKKHTIAQFQKRTSHFIKIVKQSHKRAGAYLSTIKRSDLTNCILQTEHELQQRFHQKFRQDDLHPHRMQIKKLIYLQEINAGGTISKKTEVYDAIQNCIGEWHDKTMLINYIKNSTSSNQVIAAKLKSARAADLKSIKVLIKALMELNAQGWD